MVALESLGSSCNALELAIRMVKDQERFEKALEEARLYQDMLPGVLRHTEYRYSIAACLTVKCIVQYEQKLL